MRSYKPLLVACIVACKELPPTMLRLTMMNNNLILTMGIVRSNRLKQLQNMMQKNLQKNDSLLPPKPKQMQPVAK